MACVLSVCSSLLTSDVFGYVSFGAVYGLIAMATQVASGLGPWMIGALEEWTGSYEVPLTLVAVLTYAALIPIYFAKPPKSVWSRVVSRLVPRSAPQRAPEGSCTLSSQGFEQGF